MENFELQTDKNYIKMVSEKCDANMKYIASRIEKADHEKSEESKQTDELMDKRMLAFAKGLDDDYKLRQKKRKFIKNFRRCIAAVVCLIVVGAFAIPSVDAWKQRPKGLQTLDRGNQLELQFGSNTEIDGLQNYYTFSKLPEGYKFESSEDNGFHRCIIFSDDSDNHLSITVFTTEAVVNLNKENAVYKEVQIRGNDGYFVSYQEENSKMIIWAEGSDFIQVQADGEGLLSDEELMELAENIKFVE